MVRTLDHILSRVQKSEISTGPFFPGEPKSLEQTGLNEIFVEELICKIVLAYGSINGQNIAGELGLPRKIVDSLLYDLKQRLYLAFQSVSGLNDFSYVLTEKGKERALLARNVTSYTGTGPVVYDEYIKSVARQSIRLEHPDRKMLEDAFHDLVLPENFYDLLGPAISSGRGLYFYGHPGNGKTEVAVRISSCFTETVYIPKTLLFEGQLIQFYDPQCHIPAPKDDSESNEMDGRWVKIYRPAVVMGGEMDFQSLEIGYNRQTGICEASMHMKANCGVFVIDDFGRQKITPEQILNRWILPMEKKIDFLAMPNGNKIQTPFDCMLVFCSNYRPSEILSEAFLRRIPYKLHIGDPDERQFLQILEREAESFAIEYSSECAEYLLQTHYRDIRPMRCCHPHDLLQQLVDMARFEKRTPEMTSSGLDRAVQLYFSEAEGGDNEV